MLNRRHAGVGGSAGLTTGPEQPLVPTGNRITIRLTFTPSSSFYTDCGNLAPPSVMNPFFYVSNFIRNVTVLRQRLHVQSMSEKYAGCLDLLTITTVGKY